MVLSTSTRGMTASSAALADESEIALDSLRVLQLQP